MTNAIAATIRYGILGLAAFALAACSTSSKSVSDTFAPEAVAEPAPEPIESQPLPKQTIADSSGPMSTRQIMAALSGRSFAYTRGKRSGTIEYLSDGTFSYEEAGKGQGTGVWQASDGKLCEAFDPTSFLPKGTKSECQPFSAKDGAYIAGKSRLTPT
jgi:hypothetical protein